MFEILSILIVLYCIAILYLRLSDNGNGKKKNIAGWLLFGMMWPKMKQQIESDPKQSEKVFYSMLITFMIAAIIVIYLISHRKIPFL